jgi:hypothetical protein
MNKSPRRILTMGAAVAALVGGTALAGTASAAPDARSAQVQAKVDAYLAEHPESRQVSADTVTIDGGTLTFAAPGQADTRQPACDYGHLCIQDAEGSFWDFYECGYYEFFPIGDGTFNNNQTPGTVAEFFDSNGDLDWTNTAPDSGTADWNDIYYVRPC